MQTKSRTLSLDAVDLEILVICLNSQNHLDPAEAIIAHMGATVGMVPQPADTTHLNTGLCVAGITDTTSLATMKPTVFLDFMAECVFNADGQRMTFMLVSDIRVGYRQLKYDLEEECQRHGARLDCLCCLTGWECACLPAMTSDLETH